MRGPRFKRRKSTTIIMIVKIMKSFPLTTGAPFSDLELGNHVPSHGYAGPAHKSHPAIYGGRGIFALKGGLPIFTNLREGKFSETRMQLGGSLCAGTGAKARFEPR